MDDCLGPHLSNFHKMLRECKKEAEIIISVLSQPEVFDKAKDVTKHFQQTDNKQEIDVFLKTIDLLRQLQNKDQVPLTVPVQETEQGRRLSAPVTDIEDHLQLRNPRRARDSADSAYYSLHRDSASLTLCPNCKKPLSLQSAIISADAKESE